ncbi:MAG: hypothetical protein AAGI24_10045 [Pseudomonadota bacterium]
MRCLEIFTRGGVLIAVLLPLPLLLPGDAWAQQPTVTLRSTVTGNQEQPRVMYILPWQTPQAQRYDYQPGAALAEELFRPLDRAEFLRELDYQQALSAATAAPNDSETSTTD